MITTEELWVFRKVDSEHVLSMEQAQKVKALIRNECCNYDNGNCEALDNGEYHRCPQMSKEKLYCAWFKEAVLPLDKVLEAAVLDIHNNNARLCVSCKSPFIPKASKSKYCHKCAVKIHKKQKVETQKRRRFEAKVKMDDPMKKVRF